MILVLICGGAGLLLGFLEGRHWVTTLIGAALGIVVGLVLNLFPGIR